MHSGGGSHFRCIGRGVEKEARVFGRIGLVYWGLTPPQQPGSYQGGEIMMMKSVIWWSFWEEYERVAVGTCE